MLYRAVTEYIRMVFLDGERVELVPFDPEDESHIAVFVRVQNEPVMRATGSYDGPFTPTQAHEWIDDIQDPTTLKVMCAIRVDEDVVGWAGTYMDDKRAHIARVYYYVLPEYQNNGYASEAAQLLIKYAFGTLNAHKVEASVIAENAASSRVLEKLGFQQEGCRRDHMYKEGEYRDVTLWGLLPSEYTD